MKKLPAFPSIIAIISLLLLSASAHAGLFRAYVSSTGNDANACSLQAPCRLLPAALAAISDGGEIWMLDSANYNTGPVNIAKSVTILAIPGMVGSVLAVNGPAVSITASGLSIALRNLAIIPLTGGGGSYGVYMTGASTLTIENSLLANLPNHGVVVSGTGTVEIDNTTIRNNSGYALSLQNGASADIHGTKMLNNSMGGIQAYSGASLNTTATVSDSLISGGTEGVYAYAPTDGNGASRIFVTRSTIQKTAFALDSEANGTGSSLIAASNSMIVNNYCSYYQGGTGSPIIRSLGNNHIADNTTSFGSLTTTLLQ